MLDGGGVVAGNAFVAGVAAKKLMSEEFRRCVCLLDLFYSGDRSLWHGVPKEGLMVSVPYEEGPPCAKNLSRELHWVLRVCSKLTIAVRVGVSPSEGVDHRSLGAPVFLSTNPTREPMPSKKRRASIHVRVQSCHHAHKLGESFSWIGRETCPGWEDPEFESFFGDCSLASVVENRRKQCLYNCSERTRNRNHRVSSGQALWKMVGNNPVCGCSVRSWRDFRRNDRVAKSIKFYPGVLTRLIWNGFGSSSIFPVMPVAVFTVNSCAVDPPRLLLWCCLVTRTVSQNSV